MTSANTMTTIRSTQFGRLLFAPSPYRPNLPMITSPTSHGTIQIAGRSILEFQVCLMVAPTAKMIRPTTKAIAIFQVNS